MAYKIKYYFEYKMDYGSNTKRYGSYILDNNNLQNSADAKNYFLKEVDSGNIDLKVILNITKGKIISKVFKIEEIIDLK